MGITIRLKRNGPYVIAADEAARLQIVDADGNPCVPEPGRSIALCRCGGSSTKPFCDGTHRRNGFVGTSDPAGVAGVEGRAGGDLLSPGPTDEDRGR